MFCTRCGTQLQPGFAVCPTCAGPLAPAPIGQSRLERHLHTLAILWMAISGLFLIPAAALMVFGRAARLFIHHQEPLAPIFPILIYLAGSTLLLLGAGGVCVGLGLLQHRPWARTAAIILAILSLFHPPFGTALGIYTLWVLLAEGHADQYNYLARST